MNDERPFPPGGVVDDVYRYRLKIDSLEAENQRLHDQIQSYNKIMAHNNIHIKGAPDGQHYEEPIQPGNAQATPWINGGRPTQSDMTLPSPFPSQYPSPGVNEDQYPSLGVFSPKTSLPGAALSTPFEGQLGRTSLGSPRYFPLTNRYTSSCGSDGNPSRVGVPQDRQQAIFAGEYPMPVPNMGFHMPMPQNPASAEPIEPSVRYFNSPRGQQGHGQLNHSNAMNFMPNNSTSKENTNDSLQLDSYNKYGSSQDEIPLDPQLERMAALPPSDNQIGGLPLPESPAPAVQGSPADQSCAWQPDIFTCFLQEDLWPSPPFEALETEADDSVVSAEENQTNSSLSDPSSFLDEHSAASPSTAAPATNNTTPSSQAVQVGIPSVQIPTVDRFLYYVGTYAVGSHMVRKPHFKNNGFPNRPWIFGYTFPGTREYALYYLSCPKIGCAAMSVHPLIDDRGAQHLRGCRCEFRDEVEMIQRYGTQMCTPRGDRPLITLEWARKWNEGILTATGQQHLASENFPTQRP